MSTFLMLARRALSTAFWSAARLLLISFFCSHTCTVSLPFSLHPSWTCMSQKIKSYLGLLSLLEEGGLADLLLGLVGGEVLGCGDLLNLLGLNAGDVDLVGCGDDVAGVDAAEGNAVDLEGAGNEKDTLVEGLQENDALAAEAAGEEDQDGTGLEGLAGSPGADGLADLVTIVVSIAVASFHDFCACCLKFDICDKGGYVIPQITSVFLLHISDSFCVRWSICDWWCPY